MDRRRGAGVPGAGRSLVLCGRRRPEHDGRSRCGAACSPEIVGLILVNPAAEPPAADVQAMIREFAADGMVVIPGDGDDIAEPDAHEIGYANTPIRPLISLIDDGLVPLSARYGELVQPLLLFTFAPGPHDRTGPERAPRRQLRRPCRPSLARAQLPRGDARLRP